MRPTSLLRQLAKPVFNKTITADGKEKLHGLLENGWTLSKNGTGIQKAYEFRGFNRAMKFWRNVAREAKDREHHPEWANVYNKVHIRWTTHKPMGLSQQDIMMAEFCDRASKEGGLKVAPGNEATYVLEEMFAEGSECEPCSEAHKSPEEKSS